MKILGICGSIRGGSLNLQLLRNVSQFFPQGIDFEIFSIAQLDWYNQDLDLEKKPSEVVAFRKAIIHSQAVLFASPEYNHDISGVLKNAIDWASRPAFESPLKHKPIGILTASMSSVGGARAQHSLKNTLNSTLSLIYPATEYLLTSAHEKFDANGILTDSQALRHLKHYMEGFIPWINTSIKQNR